MQSEINYWERFMIIINTLDLRHRMMKTLAITWKVASTKMNMWSWWSASKDNNGTFPCPQWLVEGISTWRRRPMVGGKELVVRGVTTLAVEEMSVFLQGSHALASCCDIHISSNLFWITDRSSDMNPNSMNSATSNIYKKKADAHRHTHISTFKQCYLLLKKRK